MENIYYKSTSVEILKRLKYLNERNYVDLSKPQNYTPTKKQSPRKWTLFLFRIF